MPQDVEAYLRSLPASDRTRAAAWDAVYTVQDDAQAEQMLRQLSLPDDAKATLWDARESQQQPAPPMAQASVMETPAAPQGLVDQVKGFGTGVWNVLNPVAAVKAGIQAGSHPIETGKQMLQQQGQMGEDALVAYGQGDYPRAVRKGAAWLLPVVGPALDRAADKMEAGQYGEGVGEAVGIGVGAVGPGKMIGGRATVPSQSRLNPTTAAAVRFGEREGIPIDAATATDSRMVRAAQRRATDSMGGAGTAERFIERQQGAFARVGDELAQRTNPGGQPQNRVSAGESVMGELEGRIRSQAGDADAAYGQLRALEQQAAQRIQTNPGGVVQSPPGQRMAFTDVPLAVDLAASKSALRPLYDSLMRESELTTLQGGKARTLVALDRLMTGPDIAPLSVVDAALGDLKSMARTGDMPELRTQGQATAAQAVQQLEAEVMAAATRGGPQVVDALQRGRQATIGKYETASVRDMLSGEPARIYSELTAGKDVSLEKLRAVAQQTPDQIPTIARAYMEDLMQKATAEGGFGRAQGLWADWQRMGPETKAVLFPDRGLRNDLNNFFLLAKKAAENPNPSGTANVLTVLNATTAAPMWAMSKLFYSRRGVQLLTRGLSIPVGSRAASAAWQAEVANLVGRDAGTAAVPVGAEGDSPTRQ
jgi:hypothetical protein